MSPPPVADSTKDGDHVEKKQAQRRINKPLIEKRRRARINECLSQLKSIVLEACDSSKMPRSSKLEKADILEMTVDFIKKRLTTAATTSSPTITTTPECLVKEGATIPSMVPVDEYVAGYTKCVEEISRFLEQTHTVNETIKQDVVSHISQKLNKSPNHSVTKDGNLRNGDKIPIIPIKKRKLKMDEPEPEVVDLSVKDMRKSESQRTDQQSQPLNLSIMSEIRAQTISESHQKATNPQLPMGLLCGGQIMLLVQVPPTVTSQQLLTTQNMPSQLTSQLLHVPKTEPTALQRHTVQSVPFSVPPNVVKTISKDTPKEPNSKPFTNADKLCDGTKEQSQSLDNEIGCVPAIPVINNANQSCIAGPSDADHWRPW